MQGKVQHNNKKKAATAETEREGTEGKKNKRKQGVVGQHLILPVLWASGTEE